MNKVIKGILATLGAVTFLSGTAYFIEQESAKKYNETFPQDYISQTYPNAEIIENNEEHSSWFGNTTSANCYCYDNEEDIYFSQEFTHDNHGRYIPRDNGGYNSYQNALATKQDIQHCMDKAAEILSDNCEYKLFRDPICHSDFLIFIKDPEIWQADELYRALNDTTNDIFRGEGRESIGYQIVICGESAYDKLTGLELFNGKADKNSGYYASAFGGFDIENNTDIKAERFDIIENGDQQIFNIYQQAYSGTYTDIIMWISGEPNKAPRDMKYEFFGLKY